VVVDDELLRKPLGVVGNAAIIPYDELDFISGNGVAVLGYVQLDGVDDPRAPVLPVFRSTA
jgi:hypothetical protein